VVEATLTSSVVLLMGNRRIEYEVREEFFELVCSGMSLQAAVELLGVARWIDLVIAGLRRLPPTSRL
jgi:hypothetical protein